MKAILWTTYGPPEALELKEIEKPVINDDQVLAMILEIVCPAAITWPDFQNRIGWQGRSDARENRA